MRVRGRELCDVKVGEGQRQGALRGPRVRVQAPGPRLQRELRVREPWVRVQGSRVQAPGSGLRAYSGLQAPGSEGPGSRVSVRVRR